MGQSKSRTTVISKMTRKACRKSCRSQYIVKELSDRRKDKVCPEIIAKRDIRSHWAIASCPTFLQQTIKRWSATDIKNSICGIQKKKYVGYFMRNRHKCVQKVGPRSESIRLASLTSCRSTPLRMNPYYYRQRMRTEAKGSGYRIVIPGMGKEVTFEKELSYTSSYF